jgi:hypothetical protein
MAAGLDGRHRDRRVPRCWCETPPPSPSSLLLAPPSQIQAQVDRLCGVTDVGRCRVGYVRAPVIGPVPSARRHGLLKGSGELPRRRDIGIPIPKGFHIPNRVRERLGHRAHDGQRQIPHMVLNSYVEVCTVRREVSIVAGVSAGGDDAGRGTTADREHATDSRTGSTLAWTSATGVEPIRWDIVPP